MGLGVEIFFIVLAVAVVAYWLWRLLFHPRRYPRR